MQQIDVDGKITMIRHGEGTSIWKKPFGGKYIGEWKNNKYHGKGKYIFANGDSWYGTYNEDRANGNGSYVLDEKNIENYTIDNKLHGYAVEETIIQS